MKEQLLVALIGLFIVVLVLRLIQSYFLARRLKAADTELPADADAKLIDLVGDAKTPQAAREAIRNITHQAPMVQSHAVRGAYYSAAGNLALNPLKRPGLAVGLYLKALRINPTCIEAITKLQEILSAQKRYRRLEWTYWEILSRLDDSEVGEEVWVACWSGLAAIYAASPNTVRRADAIRKALTAFMQDDDEDDDEKRASRIPQVSILDREG